MTVCLSCPIRIVLLRTNRHIVEERQKDPDSIHVEVVFKSEEERETTRLSIEREVTAAELLERAVTHFNTKVSQYIRQLSYPVLLELVALNVYLYTG